MEIPAKIQMHIWEDDIDSAYDEVREEHSLVYFRGVRNVYLHIEWEALGF